jgi:hypothetical protein
MTRLPSFYDTPKYIMASGLLETISFFSDQKEALNKRTEVDGRVTAPTDEGNTIE